MNERNHKSSRLPALLLKAAIPLSTLAAGFLLPLWVSEQPGIVQALSTLLTPQQHLRLEVGLFVLFLSSWCFTGYLFFSHPKSVTRGWKLHPKATAWQDPKTGIY